MSAAKCPQCGRDADFVETFHGARSCFHPFHAAKERDASIYDDAAEYLAERDTLRALLVEARRDLLVGSPDNSWGLVQRIDAALK